MLQDRITPDDPRYRAVVEKRFNKRFTAKPDYVRLAHSTDDVVAAVAGAARENRRLAVTSGGLYFRDGYPRLQRTKARWDPRDVFHYALSIRAR